MYNKGRKKPSKQLILKKVWAMVYVDYMAEFPISSFKEDNLKDHLRDSLQDMKFGINNPDDGETVLL